MVTNCKKLICIRYSVNLSRHLFKSCVPGSITGERLFVIREIGHMKASIHPKYTTIQVACNCGHTFETRSTLNQNLPIEVCAECHPFYTGKQKLVDTSGRVEKFRNRYNRTSSQSASNK